MNFRFFKLLPLVVALLLALLAPALAPGATPRLSENPQRGAPTLNQDVRQAPTPLSADLPQGCASAYDGLVSESLLAPVRGASSRILQTTDRNLQKVFTKHGSDFGLSGNWNPGRATDVSRAINSHINAPGVQAIQGTYRGQSVIHYLDPKTGLNVISDPSGGFIGGWRLGPDQLKSVTSSGRLF